MFNDLSPTSLKKIVTIVKEKCLYILIIIYILFLFNKNIIIIFNILKILKTITNINKFYKT